MGVGFSDLEHIPLGPSHFSHPWGFTFFIFFLFIFLFSISFLGGVAMGGQWQAIEPNSYFGLICKDSVETFPKGKSLSLTYLPKKKMQEEKQRKKRPHILIKGFNFKEDNLANVSIIIMDF